jgi:hypothetical protein
MKSAMSYQGLVKDIAKHDSGMLGNAPLGSPRSRQLLRPSHTGTVIMNRLVNDPLTLIFYFR